MPGGKRATGLLFTHFGNVDDYLVGYAVDRSFQISAAESAGTRIRQAVAALTENGVAKWSHYSNLFAGQRFCDFPEKKSKCPPPPLREWPPTAIGFFPRSRKFRDLQERRIMRRF
jgi:hypothetical protein